MGLSSDLNHSQFEPSLEGAEFDLLVIGGGINGTAIARDAAGRGLSVLLCERDDLGGHTSSSSSKLIHGGLRYLEQYDFALVRHALMEREVLLRSAPHIIWPLRFVLPYEPQRRPKWLLRLGLFIYDNLGGRKLLPGTKSIRLDQGAQAEILKAHLTSGFEYSDCWVEDARLVVLNARDAADRGAQIRTRTEVMDIESRKSGYSVTLQNRAGDEVNIMARGLVNAAGPWVDDVVRKFKPGRNASSVRLVKGSHIVVPRHFEGHHSYIFQNDDGRIIFALPYEGEYTLIGTTDVPYMRGEGAVVASEEEVSYLCAAASEYFKTPISPESVVWTYSGVRPLYDDHSSEASEVTRDYVLDLFESDHNAPILSVYGGKVTTSRRLAEHAMRRLGPFYSNMEGDWTAGAHLPGGDILDADFDVFYEGAMREFSQVPRDFMRKLCRRYGTAVREILIEGPGQMFEMELCSAEIDYVLRREWVMTGDDMLWRRTKAGLHMSESGKKAVREYINTQINFAELGQKSELTAVS